MIIRPALAQDAAPITAIYADHVRDGAATFDTVPRTLAETSVIVGQCAARGWPFLVAERDGLLLGYAYAMQLRDRPGYAFACENSIYIHPDHLGQGIGKALLAALLPAATDAGFRQMIAVIGGDEAASVGLHARLGFGHAGRVRSVGRKFGRWLDVIYMQAELGSGDSDAPGWEP